MISLLPFLIGCDELSGSSSGTKKTSASQAGASSTPTKGTPGLILEKITVEDSIIPLPQGTQAGSGKTPPKTASHNPFLVCRGQSFSLSFTATITTYDESGNIISIEPAADIPVVFAASSDLQITGTNPSTSRTRSDGTIDVYLNAPAYNVFWGGLRDWLINVKCRIMNYECRIIVGEQARRLI